MLGISEIAHRNNWTQIKWPHCRISTCIESHLSITLSTCLFPSTPPCSETENEVSNHTLHMKDHDCRDSLLRTSKTRIKLRITAYSPLRMASSEFGMLSLTVDTLLKIFPIEPVLGIPDQQTHRSETWKTNNSFNTGSA